MKKTGIYKITNPKGKIYIGQSVDVFSRIKSYKYLNCKSQRKLYNSFKKYGVDSHIFEVIEECSIELLNDRERYWQEYYDVIKNGLNCSLTKTSEKSGHQSSVTKNIISIKSKLWYSKNKHPRLGVKIDEELKIKFSKARKGLLCGERNPNYGKKGKLNHNYGKKRKEETIQKITGENNKKSNIILDTETGVYYFGFREVAECIDSTSDNVKYRLRRKNDLHKFKIT